MPTMKDVAKEAGVALGTVSRYLNGAEIKERNRLLIEEAIKKLDFKLNPIARCLKTNKTHTVGVIIPGVSDPYSSTIVRSMEQKLFEAGYSVFICNSWGKRELEQQKVELLKQRMVDGLILYPASEDISHLKCLQEGEFPVVVVDTCVSGIECDQVLTDNISATYNAVEWLINHHHKKIGLICGTREYFTSRERLKGYERVYEYYSMQVDENLVMTLGFDEKSGYDSMTRLLNLPVPPTAVVACNYYTTLGAVKAVYASGVKIPEQLSFIGFDNLGFTDLVQPPLSIITQPMEEMGTKAAELLLRRMEGDSVSFPSVVRLKPGLLMKESVRNCSQ